MRQYLKKILDKDKLPIIFGGDHSISYPLISEFAKKYNGDNLTIFIDKPSKQ